MSQQEDLLLTLFALAVFAGIGVFSFRKHFAEHNELTPRMVPWMFISLACIATIFMLVVHLVNLFGWETGRK